ncbi:tigger transposable element-derived protein 6-like [Neodiprion fabricii]|uniref:tigger transposable element-derived protein 6-like n=1 Tax=Neodiprion fabricii TaxID=2872261 RepID=UPI001ED906F4|nr:tigger transposable element-derived protein 6-like [Neodiprion fabricii]
MPKWEYVELLYLPANTTSKLQPMDQGIINNFKVYYRKEVVQYVLKSIEDDKSPEINILQAMRFARKAWFSVSKTTISNGYKKAGFKVTNVSEPENLQEEVETIARFPEWNKLIFTCRNNENDQQPSFQDFVSMDDGPLKSQLTRFHCNMCTVSGFAEENIQALVTESSVQYVLSKDVSLTSQFFVTDCEEWRNKSTSHSLWILLWNGG